MSVRLGLGGCVFELDVPRSRAPLHSAFADLDVPSLQAPAALWSIQRDLGACSGPKGSWPEWSLDAESRRILISGKFPVRAAAPFLHDAMLAALRLHGRLSLHAAAVAAPARPDTILLLGDSGHGKSTLTWNALVRGGRLVSDDLIGLYEDKRGELALCPLRRSMAITAEVLASSPPPEGRWESQRGLRKLRFDPEEWRPGARLDPARPGRLAFLERGLARRIVALTPTQAFERLVQQTPVVWADATAPRNLDLLRRLAEETPAVVATLTKACLTDDALLDELAA